MATLCTLFKGFSVGASPLYVLGNRALSSQSMKCMKVILLVLKAVLPLAWPKIQRMAYCIGNAKQLHRSYIGIVERA